MTDSWAGELRPLDCLGFLPGSCCPHYDGEADRRPSYHRLLANGEIAAGVAIEDWTGVHFIGTEIHRVIAAKAGARLASGGLAMVAEFGVGVAREATFSTMQPLNKQLAKAINTTSRGRTTLPPPTRGNYTGLCLVVTVRISSRFVRAGQPVALG